MSSFCWPWYCLPFLDLSFWVNIPLCVLRKNSYGPYCPSGVLKGTGLLALRQHLGSHPDLVGIRVTHLFIICVVVLCLCSSRVLCTNAPSVSCLAILDCPFGVFCNVYSIRKIQIQTQIRVCFIYYWTWKEDKIIKNEMG